MADGYSFKRATTITFSSLRRTSLLPNIGVFSDTSSINWSDCIENREFVSLVSERGNGSRLPASDFTVMSGKDHKSLSIKELKDEFGKSYHSQTE